MKSVRRAGSIWRARTARDARCAAVKRFGRIVRFPGQPIGVAVSWARYGAQLWRGSGSFQEEAVLADTLERLVTYR